MKSRNLLEVIICSVIRYSDHYHSWVHTVWLQIFDRENFHEKPNFRINRNFRNKIFVNSCHFRDTILIDNAAMDTGISSVPDEEFRFTSCIRGFHVYEGAWTPTHHEILLRREMYTILMP